MGIYEIEASAKSCPDESRSLIPEKGSSILNVLENSDDPVELLQAWSRGIPFDDRLRRIQELLPAFPDDHFARPVLMFDLAAIVARAGDMKTSDKLIQGSTALLLRNFGAVAGHQSAKNILRNMLLHAFYFDPALDVRSPREDLGGFDARAIDRQERRQGAVILASANGIYVERFGRSFIDGIPAGSEVVNVHIHVVTPTERTEPYLKTLAATCGFPLTWTFENQDLGLAYVACKRFIIAARVMRHFERDLVISDLDGAFTSPQALDVRHMLGNANAGLFEVSEPYELDQICHCSVSYWRHTPETVRFLELISRYNIDRLRATDQFWMLDQLALFVLSRRAQRGEFSDIFGPSGFVWKDLTASHGDRSRYQRDTKIPVEEKYRLRRQYRNDFGDADEFSVSLCNGRLVPEGALKTRIG